MTLSTQTRSRLEIEWCSMPPYILLGDLELPSESCLIESMYVFQFGYILCCSSKYRRFPKPLKKKKLAYLLVSGWSGWKSMASGNRKQESNGKIQTPWLRWQTRIKMEINWWNICGERSGGKGLEMKRKNLTENEMPSISHKIPSSLRLVLLELTISAHIVCERGNREYDHRKWYFKLPHILLITDLTCSMSFNEGT